MRKAMGSHRGWRQMNITILCVGHLKESYWKEAESEYLKRLGAYAKTAVVEVDDLPTKEKNSPNEEEQVKEQECERLLWHCRLQPRRSHLSLYQ